MLAKFPDYSASSSTSSMLRSSPRASTFGVLAFILIILYTFKLGGPAVHFVNTPSKSAESAVSQASVATGLASPSQASIAPLPAVSGDPSIAKPATTTLERKPLSTHALANIELWNNTGFVPYLHGKKVATIIEDRALDNLMPIILHFSSVLGPEWPIVLFTSVDIIPNSAPVQRLMNEGRLFIEQLPKSVHFSNHASVSAFLTKPWLWNQLAPADHVLIFQADSMICANSPQRVEDFLQYDLVGAPIDSNRFGNGYNGGLSLRNRNLILDIIYSSDFDNETLAVGGGVNVEFEDQWFYKKMTELPARPSPLGDGLMLPGANLPPQEIAMKFAVETISYDWPLGYHQPARWQEDNMEQIEKWCPEVKMCTDDLIALRGKEKQKTCQEQLEQLQAKTWQDLKKEEEERIAEEQRQAEEAKKEAEQLEKIAQEQDGPTEEQRLVDEDAKKEAERLEKAAQEQNGPVEEQTATGTATAAAAAATATATA